MICVIHYARENKIPYLGVCLGSQLMAIEFARHVLGYTDATSAEFDPSNTSAHHIVHIMEDQKNITTKGGTMRVGSYNCVVKKGSKVEKCYRDDLTLNSLSYQEREVTTISERHRHRYEFNNQYRQEFEDA
jgi:CTP synthase